MAGTVFGTLLFAFAIAAGVLVLLFVLVPLLKMLGWLIAGIFRGIGFLIMHVAEFVGGTISDVLRLVGAVLAFVVLTPITLLNLVIGRWSAAGHFAESVTRECKVASSCVYRVVLRRPLKLLFLHGLLEGVEQRVPEAMAAAPTSDRPRHRVGTFPGYTIVGSLRGGGSGAKLYIAAPDDDVRARYPGMPDRVVIKSFALSEGSSMPQIVRESRALECAKQLGLVFDHDMDERRFYYVMAYHEGDHLGIVTRQLHGETDGKGLERGQFATALRFVSDLTGTLAGYHRGGLWHKDVKPENIIINESGAHLVDLGLVTPLRSAMTLTTHGTEYFRDPELVRQALRGVKVHQIDGAKFDIYAVGAVLYFVIENTFPPHGALSRFTRRSPDALRWIVRRAMADYSHRYTTADDLLADLTHVAAAPDPFAVKPADLPSMHGRAAETSPPMDEPEFETSARAGSPVPPASPEPAEPFVVGVAAGGGQAVSPAAVAPAGAARRPKIRVTNWWTGEYSVEDRGTATVGPAMVSPGRLDPRQVGFARAHSTAMRHEAAELRRKVRSGAISARRAAREQIKSARTRAREIRQRARARRPGARARAEGRPSFMLVAIGLGALMLLGVAAVGFLSVDSGHSRGQHMISVTVPSVPPVPRIPVLLVNGGDGLDGFGLDEEAIDEIIEDYQREDGYDIIVNERVARHGLRTLVEEWRRTKGTEPDQHRAIDLALEEELARFNLYGVLYVAGRAGHDPEHVVIYSGRDDAKSRRYETAVAVPLVDLPYLLVNDHPTKHQAEIAALIADRIGQYESAGWRLLVDDEVEAEVREALPPGGVDASLEMSERLRGVLERAGLGGILHISHARGRTGTGDDVVLTSLDAE